jgi:hypothetical protein
MVAAAAHLSPVGSPDEVAGEHLPIGPLREREGERERERERERGGGGIRGGAICAYWWGMCVYACVFVCVCVCVCVRERDR